MAEQAHQFTITRHLGMYDTCRDLTAWHFGPQGKGHCIEDVGGAHLTVTEDGPRWFVSAYGRESIVEIEEQAELTLRLMCAAGPAYSKQQSAA